MKLKKDAKRELIFIAGFSLSGAAWVVNLINTNSSVIYRCEVIGRYFNLFPEIFFNALRIKCGSNKGWEF